MNQTPATASACAAAVLEAVPHLMRVIREQVRSQSTPDLSVAQFRALAFIGRNADAMLSDVAAFLAQPLPTASKLVDGLVAAELAVRDIGAKDRRKVALTLTAGGRRKYQAVLKSAESYLAARIRGVSTVRREEILRAMETLNAIFHDPAETAAAGRKTP